MKTLRFEMLEPRRVLAGNVTAELVNGEIQITGDKLGNEVDVSQVGSDIVVQGLSGTNVNSGTDPVAFPTAEVVDLVIKMKQGEDSLGLSGAFPGDVSVDTGNGADSIGVAGLSVGGNLDIDTREGDDFLEFPGSQNNVTGNVNVNMRQGHDFLRVFFSDNIFGGDFTINTAQGNDSVAMLAGPLAPNVINVGGNLQVSTGQGDDTVGIAASNFFGFPPASLSIGGNMEIDLGQGNDVLDSATIASFGSISVAGDLTVRAGGGDDQVSIAPPLFGFTVGGDLLLDGGPGDDGPLEMPPGLVVLDPGVIVVGSITVINFETL